MLLLPFVVALFLYSGVVGIGGFIVGPEFAGVMSGAFAFLLPTLYGAMAFGADQRGAAIASSPSMPRGHATSGSAGISSGWDRCSCSRLCLSSPQPSSPWSVSNTKPASSLRDEYWLYSQSTGSITRELHQALGFVISGSLLAWLGGLTAYSIGQLCSMLLRSEILAAFLGIVLSTVLSAWIAVVLLWDLNPWLCLLPLFGGLMLATWLRAPDWIAGRNSWRSWWKPALAMVLPIVLLGILLPEMRRLPAVPHASISLPFRLNPNHYGNGDTPAARETAAMYEQASQLSVRAPEQEFVDRWYKREFASEEDGLGYGGIDETKMSAKEREEYRKELKEQEQILDQNLRRAADLVIEASRRPSCRFDIDWSGTPVPTEHDWRYYDREQAWTKIHANFYFALALPLNVPYAELSPAEAVEFQLAALRLLDHLRQGQPTSVAYRVLSVEREFLERVVEWAENPAVPTADVRKLLTQLQQYFRVAPIDPVAPFDADERIVRDVLLGTTPPLILAEEEVDYAKYLAFLANELPWERERALVALDRITLQHQREAKLLADFIHRVRDVAFPHQYLQRWLSNRYSASETAALWNSQLSGAATSYLTRLEYDARVPVRQWFQQVLETETSRRAAVLRLALLLYQRDHGKYPALLSDLVPNYLDELPNDPFTGGMQPFSYAPAGVDLPVKRYGNWGVDEIAPQTPLVWSAGPSNVRLKRREIVLLDSRRSRIPPSIRCEHKETYYVLEGDQDAWDRYSVRPLVFPLPRIRTPPAE